MASTVVATVPPAIRPAIRSKRKLVSPTTRIVNRKVVRFVVSAQPVLKLIGNHGRAVGEIIP
jgi:hypothetical protein